jgi:hypothetical protein
VAVSLNSLPPLLVWSLPSIEDKDGIYWQLEQMAAARKQCHQLGALGIAMTIACHVNPTTGHSMSALAVYRHNVTHLASIPTRYPRIPATLSMNPFSTARLRKETDFETGVRSCGWVQGRVSIKQLLNQYSNPYRPQSFDTHGADDSSRQT